MLKLHCDLCGRDMTKDGNTNKVTWEDNNEVDTSCGHGLIFRKQRKFSADICDDCIERLRKAVRNETD